MRTQALVEEAIWPFAETERTHFSFANVVATILPAVVEVRVAGGAGLGSGVLVAQEENRYFAVTNNHVVG